LRVHAGSLGSTAPAGCSWGVAGQNGGRIGETGLQYDGSTFAEKAV